MPQTTIHKLGAPRRLTGECNTWDVIWALQVNGTVHQVSMKRRFSQKLAVKHNGKTLLDKVFVFAKPYEGYCFVAWVSQGVNFGIYYNTPLMSIRTNSSHYDLRVNGIKFSDLPDGCGLRQAHREVALRRAASLPALSNNNSGVAPASGDEVSGGRKNQPASRVAPRPGNGGGATRNSNAQKERRRRTGNKSAALAKSASIPNLPVSG